MHQNPTAGSTMPRVSVVICTANRLPQLQRAIEACRQQTYRPLEVIVVAGPCTDGTEAWVTKLPDIKLRKIKVLQLGTARNEGIRAAAGDIVAFMDDDAHPSPRWIEELVRVFQSEGPTCGAVGGAVINECQRSRPLQFRYGIVHEIGDTDDVRLEPGDANDPAGPWYNRLMGTNMAFRREALLEVGGFDERYLYLHDDTDICVTLIRAGYRVIQHGRAIMHHFPAKGHNRRSDYELNWFDIIRSSTYFTLKHTRQGRKAGLRAVLRRHKHLLPQFARWLARGEINLSAYFRFTSRWFQGLYVGFRQGSERRLAPPPARMTVEEPTDFTPLSASPNVLKPLRTVSRTVRAALKVGAEPKRTLRIGLVCGDFGVQPGGVAMYTQHVAESLGNLGHSVVVFRAGFGRCTLRPWSYQIVDVPAHRIGATSLQSAVYESIYETAVERPFDVLEAPLWNGEGCAIGMSATTPLVLRLETPQEVIRQLSNLPLDHAMRATIAAERLGLSYAAGTIAISKAVWKTIEQVYDCRIETHSRTGTVIPLGLPGPEALERRPLPIPVAGDPKFLYVGRLEARKGPIELAEAFAQVAQILPQATLWIVGSDNSINDGFYARTGMSYIDKLKSYWSPAVAARVHFFGPVSEAEKNYLYSQCDAFVAPSRYESFGLIFVEAMRYGKPTIGTLAGGIPEIVQDGTTGLLVPVESPSELSRAMLTMGRDAALRQRMGEAGRQRFEDEFTLRRCAQRTEQFYRQVLAAWDGRGIGTLDHQTRRDAKRKLLRLAA